jgi:hypothetical protein
MATYRQIHVKIWASPDFQKLSPNGKFIFIYLFSNSHRSESGVYRITPKTISNETDIPVAEVEKALQEIMDINLIKYDFEQNIIWVINAVKYQKLSPNEVRGIYKNIFSINHEYCKELLETHKELLSSYLTTEQYLASTLGVPSGKGKGKGKGKDKYIYTSEEKEKTDKNLEAKQTLFDLWNSQDITVHRQITPEISKAIDKALKKWDEETITEAIRRYGIVYHDTEYFFKHKWKLENFLTQKNALPDFLDEGEKWQNYQRNQQQTSPQSQIVYVAPDGSHYKELRSDGTLVTVIG